MRRLIHRCVLFAASLMVALTIFAEEFVSGAGSLAEGFRLVLAATQCMNCWRPPVTGEPPRCFVEFWRSG